MIGLGGVAGWFYTPVSGPVADLQVVARGALGAAAAPATETGSAKIVAMTPAEIKLRLDVILASPVRNSQEMQLLMARWVATDLESAKAWMRAFPDDQAKPYDSRSQTLKEFFKAWAALDPKAAMAEALAVGGEKTFTAQDSVIVGLARADFATIQEVLTNTPAGKNNPRDAVAELMKQLIARDRPAALALARTLPGAMGDGAVQGISSVWARTDPGAALAWSQEHPDAGTRDSAMKTIFTEWARQDPQAVGPMLLQKREGQADVFHTDAAAEAVARLSESSPEAAAKFVKEFYPQDKLRANLSSLFFRLMGGDAGNPQSAAAMCAVVNVLPEDVMKTTKLLRGGWMSDLKPSWERILAEPDSPGRQFLLGEIGRKFTTQNPTQFILDVMKFPEAGSREEVLRVAFGEDGGFNFTLTREGTEAFRKAVDSMPESVRNLGAAHLAWSLGALDPQSAAEVIRQYPGAAESPNLVENLGIRLTEKVDLPTAQAWAGSLPTVEAQGKGFSGIVMGHYYEDSEATSEWVRSLPPGFGRDSAASSLANRAKEDDPEAAFAWAASVQDDKLRNDAAKGVIKSWAAVDRLAAQQAVEESSLPADQKTSLLNSLSGQP